MKKILFIMCFLIVLSGTAKAEIFSEVDDFDNTKYIYSYFKPAGIERIEGFYIREIVFQKKITANNVEYTLTFGNFLSKYISIHKEVLVKFNGNDNEIYPLPKSIYANHVILSILSESIVDKILSNNKITLRVPVIENSLLTRRNVQNIIVDIPEKVINEWRQVIQSQ